jgi:hypothetical protein
VCAGSITISKGAKAAAPTVMPTPAPMPVTTVAAVATKPAVATTTVAATKPAAATTTVAAVATKPAAATTTVAATKPAPVAVAQAPAAKTVTVTKQVGRGCRRGRSRDEAVHATASRCSLPRTDMCCAGHCALVSAHTRAAA